MHLIELITGRTAEQVHPGVQRSANSHSRTANNTFLLTGFGLGCARFAINCRELEDRRFTGCVDVDTLPPRFLHQGGGDSNGSPFHERAATSGDFTMAI